MYKFKKCISALLSALILLSCLGLAVQAQENIAVADTLYGAVSGKKYDGGVCYYGVPYAKATTKELRFMPPVAPEKWQGTYDATVQPLKPIQGSYSKSSQSEDSLKLNIWVPDTQSDEPLAVMFWIYGGSYSMGGIGESYYDMERMANDTGCIIVSANYRLNVCGFLDLREVVPGATVNNGLRDLSFALKWVNENISNFGGDPDNVTVFGQSAGAALALALLAVPEAENYFHKVISQSACGDSFFSPEQARQQRDKWLSYMGNPTGEELINMSPKKLMSANGIMDVTNIFDKGIDCVYNPVIDGEFMVCHPSELPEERINKKLLIGCTENEASLFLFFVKWPLTLLPLAHKVAMPDYSAELKNTVTQGLRFPTTNSLITLTTERMYQYPLTVMADSYSEKADVYAYRYDYMPTLVKILGLGAFHATDIPVLFDAGIMLGSLKIKATYSDISDEVGTRMRNYWGNFAKDGCPDENWTRYTADERATLIIDENDKIINDPYGERLSLYSDYISPWKR